MRNGLKKIFVFIITGLVRPCFRIHRWMIDKVFLVQLKNKALPPSILAYPIYGFLGLIWLIKKSWDVAYTEYGLKLYSKWTSIHYGPKGRGYFNYDTLNNQEKLGLYGYPVGRVKYFLNNNSHVLGYKNGESFLDAGCGRGQNIKVLHDYFPSSTIHGFDVSEGAIDVIKSSIHEQKCVRAEVGSVTDKMYLECYPDNAFNHVLISHVFAFLMASGKQATHKMRQDIIDELVRISNNTVLILDGGLSIFNFGSPSFEIEQLHRATYNESIIPYFKKHLAHGEICMLSSPETMGLLYKKYSHSE